MSWCTRFDYPYEEIKRQAECALWQEYNDKKWIAVRYPFAVGTDDYTERVRFYVEHTMREIPMRIDNIDYQMHLTMESRNIVLIRRLLKSWDSTFRN